jgi:hypothetical protein
LLTAVAAPANENVDSAAPIARRERNYVRVAEPSHVSTRMAIALTGTGHDASTSDPVFG